MGLGWRVWEAYSFEDVLDLGFGFLLVFRGFRRDAGVRGVL